MALFLHLLHGSGSLPHPLGLLRQVQVQHGNATRLDVSLGQRVDHQHHPDGPLALPVPGDGVEQVVCVQALAPLVRRHPGGQHELDVVQVSLEPEVDVVGKQVLQVLSLRQELAAGQRRDGVRVGQIQLEVHDAALLEGLLGALGDEVPDACVRDVNGAVEVRGRVSLYRPQEGVELALLETKKERGSFIRHLITKPS